MSRTTSGMKEYYLLVHEYIEGDDEHLKYIGIFSDRNKANEAIENLKTRAGFIKFPDGFSIENAFVDRGFWEEGFVYDDLDC